MATPTNIAIEKLNNVPINTYSDFALSPSAKRNNDFAAMINPTASYCHNSTNTNERSRSTTPINFPALGKSPVLSSALPLFTLIFASLIISLIIMLDGFTLVREIREELHAEIEVGRLVDTVEYDYPKFHMVMRCYLCRLISEEIELVEHEAARWLDIDSVWSVKWLPSDIEVIEDLFGGQFCAE